MKYFSYAYNIQKHSSNDEKYSPFESVFSKYPNKLKNNLNSKIDRVYNLENYVIEAKYRLQMSHRSTIEEIINKIKIRNKKYYNKKSNTLKIAIGDKVKVAREP